MSDSSTTEDYTALQGGESQLTINLTDAGEKAGDADRIMRAINSLVLLYSASTTMLQKPTKGLQILGVGGEKDRYVTVMGDREAMHTVRSVVESIPDAVADIDPEDEVDINELVYSFPIFDELKDLETESSSLASEMKNIKETVYRGVLLSLESGILPKDEEAGDELPARESSSSDLKNQHSTGVILSPLESVGQTTKEINVDLSPTQPLKKQLNLPKRDTAGAGVDIELQP